MARLNAAWLNFSERGQVWTHFWQDAAVVGGGQTYTLAGGAVGVIYASGTSSTAAGITYIVAGGSITAAVALGSRVAMRARLGRATLASIAGGTRAVAYQETGLAVAVAMTRAARNINVARGGKVAVLALGTGATATKAPSEPTLNIYAYPPDMQGMAIHGRPGKLLIRRAHEHERTHS